MAAQLDPGVVMVNELSWVAAMGFFWVAGGDHLDHGNGLALCAVLLDQLDLPADVRVKRISNPAALVVLAFVRLCPSTRSGVHELAPVHGEVEVTVNVRLIGMENARMSAPLALFFSEDPFLGSLSVG